MAHVCHIGIVDVESAASGFERDLPNPRLRSQTPKIRPRPAPNRPGAMALGHIVAQREWNRRDTTMAVRADVRMKIVPRTPRLGSDASGHPWSIGIAAPVTLGAWVRNAKPTGESLDALHHEGPKSQKLGQPLPGSRILSFFLHK